VLKVSLGIRSDQSAGLTGRPSIAGQPDFVLEPSAREDDLSCSVQIVHSGEYLIPSEFWDSRDNILKREWSFKLEGIDDQRFRMAVRHNLLFLMVGRGHYLATRVFEDGLCVLATMSGVSVAAVLDSLELLKIIWPFFRDSMVKICGLDGDHNGTSGLGQVGFGP
jgi:hypothetical protein